MDEMAGSRNNQVDGSRGAGASLAVRLTRHSIELPDRRRAGVAIAGWGVPLVVVNGFGAEGVLYAQTTSRLVSMGMKVVAIDTPGHGDSWTAPLPAATIETSAEFVGHAMDALGIGPCLMLGHSMGGRVAAHLAAARPTQVAGLVLVDPILGAAWDRTVASLRVPPRVGALIVGAMGELLECFNPGDPSQTGVVGRALGRTSMHHVLRPWRLAGPALAIARATSSDSLLSQLSAGPTSILIIHGERDRFVPLQAALDARDATGATLVVVDVAGHNWILQDPEILPAVFGEQLRGELGDAYTNVVRGAGLDPAAATVVDMELACYHDEALVRFLTGMTPGGVSGISAPRA